MGIVKKIKRHEKNNKKKQKKHTHTHTNNIE